MEKEKTMLDEQIEAQCEIVENLEPGSEERSRAVEDLTKLYRSKREDSQSRTEIVLRMIELGVPLIVFSGLTILGFRFESTGHGVSLKFLNNLIRWIKPNK